jgi:hypothetical protein
MFNAQKWKAYVKDIYNIPKRNEDAIKKAVSQFGPVSVGKFSKKNLFVMRYEIKSISGSSHINILQWL